MGKHKGSDSQAALQEAVRLAREAARVERLAREAAEAERRRRDADVFLHGGIE